MELKTISGDVIFSLDTAETIAQLVAAALAAKKSLCAANLYGANLRGANLREAEAIPDFFAAQLSITPEDGSFVGWKKCQDAVIVKILIPHDARRSNGTTRKCRASHVDVLEVIGAEVGVGDYDNKTEYRAGQRVTADAWDEDRWNACSHGIHFYLTRAEAEAHVI